MRRGTGERTWEKNGIVAQWPGGGCGAGSTRSQPSRPTGPWSSSSGRHSTELGALVGWQNINPCLRSSCSGKEQGGPKACVLGGRFELEGSIEKFAPKNRPRIWGNFGM